MHLRNLEGVVASGRLFCESDRQNQGGNWVSIAHENIQDRRRATQVPCGPRGTLCDYVPWYFAPRSPMLYAHYRGNVPGNPDGQNPIIYFRSTVQRVIEARIPFVFTNGHAIMFNSRFFDDIRNLDKIDWPLMQSTYWNATDTDPDRPRRRQAEFLVHESFPLPLIDEIVVFDRQVLVTAENCLQTSSHGPIIRVDKRWYF